MQNEAVVSRRKSLYRTGNSLLQGLLYLPKKKRSLEFDEKTVWCKLRRMSSEGAALVLQVQGDWATGKGQASLSGWEKVRELT
jgi:hypothetical protein